MNKISSKFIKENNARILSGFEIQPRYEQGPPQTKKEKRERLAADELNLLMAINLHQYKSTLTQIAEIAGFSAYKSTKLFKALEQGEMIKTVKVVKGKGVSKYPVLLESAYNLLNVKEKKYYGKGAGYEHVIWQYLIAEHFSEFKPVIELSKNGKFIDVAIEREGRLLAIEVAMTSANEKVNLEKDFSLARADKVIIGCKDSKVLEEVEQILSEMHEGVRQKTKACLLREVLSLKSAEVI